MTEIRHTSPPGVAPIGPGPEPSCNAGLPNATKLDTPAGLPGDRYLALVMAQWRAQQRVDWQLDDDELEGVDLGQALDVDELGFPLPLGKEESRAP